MDRLDSLVQDIYQMAETKSHPARVPAEQIFNDFGKNMESILRDWIYPKDYSGGTLRMSNIGQPDRKLWYRHRKDKYKGEKLKAHTLIKFLYGHLIEEMILALVKLSGHDVTDEQKRVEVEGIKGSMDCKIDGVLTDVKSVSTYGFKKFKENQLEYDDPFGYIDQLSGYGQAEGADQAAFLAMDKQNGHLTTTKIDLINKDVVSRIKHVKEMIEDDNIPEPCYDLVPDGKSGNMKLPIGCSYCEYKKHCYPNMRVFAYSTGPRFLAVVNVEPKVMEIKNYE
jgi:hypothetical protein